MSHVEESMQIAVKEVEKWANSWEKTKVVCFSKKTKTLNIKFKFYLQELEETSGMRFLGI